MNTVIKKYLTWAAMLVFLTCGVAGAADEVEVKVGVSTQNVYLGESLIFQIQVSGEKPPAIAEPLKIDGFSVVKAGSGYQDRRMHITVNGKPMTQGFAGHVVQYQLTPKKKGRLVIPPLKVTVGTETKVTPPIPITVSVPGQRADMKLQVSLSEENVYPGQPLTMTVRWLLDPAITDRVARHDLNLPVLQGGDFSVIPEEQKRDPEQRQVQVDGQTYHAVTWKYTLFPNKAGTLTIPEGALVCQLTKGRARRRRDPFDDFFRFGQRQATEKVVIPSKSITLAVKPLPKEGKPAAFNGLIGRYQIETEASPLAVNVGDPITLKIRVSGPDYLGNVEAPALERQTNLTKGFKLPSDRPAGKVQGGSIVFERIIRPRNDKVKAIPAIELPYFDVSTGRYEIAKSGPIPLTVRSTRVVTAADAEGRQGLQEGPQSSSLESVIGGIAHNYGADACLVAQIPAVGSRLVSTAGLVVVTVPPVLWLSLFIVTGIIRKRRDNPAAVQARQAYGRLQQDLKQADDFSALFAVTKQYLGSKLYLAPGALTYRDVEARLQGRIEVDNLGQLKELFDKGEAARFAGAASSDDVEETVQSVRQLAQQLEKVL